MHVRGGVDTRRLPRRASRLAARHTVRIVRDEEPRPPAKLAAGPKLWALQAVVWAWLLVSSLLRLDEPRDAMWWFNLVTAVASPCVFVVTVVAAVRAYRAGRRGWYHDPERH